MCNSNSGRWYRSRVAVNVTACWSVNVDVDVGFTWFISKYRRRREVRQGFASDDGIVPRDAWHDY